MTATLDLPIFPLRSVLYPDGRLMLRIFEARYVDMTKACIGNDEVFGVCAIVEGQEVGSPALPARIGCTARIVEWDVPAPGLFNLVARGELVFRLHEHRSLPSGLIRARVELEPAAAPQALPPQHSGLAGLMQEIIERLPPEHTAQLPTPHRLDDAAWVAHRLAEILPLPTPRRLALLGEADALRKLDLIEELLRQHQQ